MLAMRLSAAASPEINMEANIISRSRLLISGNIVNATVIVFDRLEDQVGDVARIHKLPVADTFRRPQFLLLPHL